jgi:hypothetical protein
MKGLSRSCSLFLAFFLALSSCTYKGTKQLNRRITLWREDNIPYGTEIAFKGLTALFPNASVHINKKAPSTLLTEEGKKAYIVIGTSMDPQPEDINAIMNLVGAGNHVFISAHRFGDSLLHTLGLKIGVGHDQSYGDMDSLELSLQDPATGDFKPYAYPGDSYDNWVTSLDSQYTSVLGRDSRGRPDLVRFTYKGGGSLCLHFAPLAFSNFFILHKENRAYYEKVLSYLPESVQDVYWDDYFRYSHRPFSAWQYILNNKSLRWAFWLLILLFLLIYLFDSKRRQRMIPLIAPLRNSSLDFVGTIGRLYYQRRDNHNLAMKMTMHFQDQVRTRYHLTVTALDDELAARLAYRTGYDKNALTHLVGYMRALPTKAYVPDEELMDLQHRLDAFYQFT